MNLKPATAPTGRFLLVFCLLASVFCLLFAAPSRAWFITDGVPQDRIYITRVNEFETLSQVGSNFDLGDTSPLIVARLGGGRLSPTNAFVCGWPVTFSVFFDARNTNDGFGPYTAATLEYHLGTNATTDTNWVLIARLESNQFQAVNGVVGSHFGVVTWTPPDISNAVYLVRFWAEIGGGIAVSADRTATNLTKDGDGLTWQDNAIIAVKTSPGRRPGM